MKNIPTLYIMCGLPASGKSTLAKIIAKETKGVIVSSDNIREKYGLDATEKVETFNLVYKEINTNLASGHNVILDATNTTMKARKNIFYNVKYDCKKICYIVNTPYEVCIKRDIQREWNGERSVGKEVINKFYKSFQIPFIEEGFDNILFTEEKDFALFEHLDDMKGFEQNSKYHTLTLFDHCVMASYLYAKRYKDINKSLETALMLHDYGKLFTKEYDENGEAHYYSHSNIGAYELMCKGLNDLEVLFYINYHMFPYNIKLEKTKIKYKKIFGDEKFNNLIVVNCFDSLAH